MTSYIHMVHLDMDGVLVDFDSYVTQIAGKHPQDFKKEEIYDFLCEQIKKENFFEKCPPFYHTIRKWMDLVNELRSRGIKVHILSASPCGECETVYNQTKAQKVAWLKLHGINVDGVIIVKQSGHKKRHARSFSVLIDDREDIVRDYIESGGYGIIYKDFDSMLERLNQYTDTVLTTQA